jgi:proteasome lid subunit RPN8/RPN11
MRPVLLFMLLMSLPEGARAQGDLDPAPVTSGPVILLHRAVADSMNTIWTRANQNWDQLADLNWMERNLGTIRDTQREFLGCLLGTVRGDTLDIDGWVPARNMKRLMTAVSGDCSGLDRYVGTFHTHPYLADTQNRATKQRLLAPQDRLSFEASDDRVALVIWDVDSLDAAARTPAGDIVHPATVQVR